MPCCQLISVFIVTWKSAQPYLPGSKIRCLMSWNKRYLEALCSVQKQKHKYQAIGSLQLGRALRGVCGGLFFSFFIPTGITSLVKYEFVTWLLFTLVAWWRGTYQPDITSTGSVIWVRISLQWVKLATTLGFYRLICFPLVRLVLWYGCLVGLVWSSFADPYHGLMVVRLVVSDTLCGLYSMELTISGLFACCWLI